MRTIRRFSAILFGLVLFFSGLIKLMDPVGTGLLVDSYLNFLHLSWLGFASGFIGVALVFFETVLGVAIVTGVWRRIVAIVSLAVMVFYTLLTVLLVIFNPSMDCGCFGEAIQLTHVQSLIKNLILLLMWLLAFVPFSSHEPTRKIKYVSFSLSSISVALFMLYCLFSIPMLDYTDYRPGNELATLDEIEWDGEYALLSFSNAAGEYCDSLAVRGMVMATSVYNVDKMSAQRWDKVSQFAARASREGFTPLVLVTATADSIEDSGCPQELLPYVYFADRKDLVTLNRSNGGASYFSDGQILAKWPVNKLPKEDRLAELSEEDPIETLAKETNASKLKLQAFMLYVLAVMLLL